MIRVAILDRHPAIHAGVEAALRAQADFTAVGSAADPRDLLTLLYRTDPDILVLDDLTHVRRVKVEWPRTRVVLYATQPQAELLLAAAIAGVDGVVDKSAPTFELLGALRAVAVGGAAIPDVGPRQRARAASRLDPRDRPIFAMRLAGTSAHDIATTVGLGLAALNARIHAIAAQIAPATA